jgi:hypothetical protein
MIAPEVDHSTLLCRKRPPFESAVLEDPKEIELLSNIDGDRAGSERTKFYLELNKATLRSAGRKRRAGTSKGSFPPTAASFTPHANAATGSDFRLSSTSLRTKKESQE